MDAAKAVSKEAPSADAQQAAETSSPEPDDAAVAAGAVAGGGEDDDEQVERFYALLDNIRAMRGMLGAGGTSAAWRKRAREAEPPWRPAFRMEDFEAEEADSDSAGCRCSAAVEKTTTKKIDVAGRRESGGCGASRPAAGEEEEGDGEVVVAEAKGPRRRARRRAGVLAVDRVGGR